MERIELKLTDAELKKLVSVLKSDSGNDEICHKINVLRGTRMEYLGKLLKTQQCEHIYDAEEEDAPCKCCGLLWQYRNFNFDDIEESAYATITISDDRLSKYFVASDNGEREVTAPVKTTKKPILPPIPKTAMPKPAIKPSPYIGEVLARIDKNTEKRGATVKSENGNVKCYYPEITVDHEERKHDSFNAMCKYWGKPASMVGQRLSRGKTLKEALETPADSTFARRTTAKPTPTNTKATSETKKVTKLSDDDLYPTVKGMRQSRQFKM